ncbi:MAG: superoxide dismutase family protein [Bacteroidetes bacterium]|nr:superoxide dismutase family protein [Bacteroidota bacterium]
MKKIQLLFAFILVAGLSASTYAQTMTNMNMSSTAKDNSIQHAVCVINPTQGNTVSGLISFTKVEGGIKVTADLEGLAPGKHGIHIHECGDCSAADGSSAGGHFNPMAMNHGAPMDAMRHEGDMGNIEANDSGKAHMEYVDHSISLEGSSSIIGRSVIIHKNEDDLKTQPTGNAGPRIGCGVIGIAK